MLETAIQKLMVDAVNDYGGHAFKAANRFLVGVVDLSIKMPGTKGNKQGWPDYNPPHAFIEVKKHDLRWDVPGSHRVTVEITKMQHDFMRDYRLAGGIVGIASFLDGRNVSELRMCVIPLHVGIMKYSVLASEYKPLGKEPLRTQTIIRLLQEHIDG